MEIDEFVKSKPFVVFFVALIVNLALATVLFRLASLAKPNPPNEEQVSDRDKLLMSQEQDMSKWLLGLSSGALTAVLAAHLKAREDNQGDRLIFMLSYAFLLTSFYGAFLSYEAKLDILSRGPVAQIYTSEFVWPTRVQFYYLLAGISCLGIATFRKPAKTVLSLVFLLLALTPKSSSAQTFNSKECITSWKTDRYGDTQNFDVDIANRTLLLIRQRRPNVVQLKSCQDVEIALDQIRFQMILKQDEVDDSAHVESALSSLSDELSSPDGSTSDVVGTIIKFLSPWEASYGTLSIHSLKKGYDVVIDGENVGRVNWIARVTPGTHRIRVLIQDTFTQVLALDNFSISAGENKTIEVPGGTQ